MTNKVICFYHKGCSDGFAAAWIFNKFFPEAEQIAVDYKSKIDVEKLAGATVYALDFSFQNDVITEICKVANFLYILDHHESLFRQSPWPDLPNLSIVYDKTRSGALITSDFLEARFGSIEFSKKINANSRALLSYVSDRDLWKFELYQSRDVNSALNSYPMDFKVWDKLQLGDLIKDGAAISRYSNQVIDNIIEENTQICILENIDGEDVEGLCCNAPRILASDLASKLALRSGTYGASYTIDKDGSYIWSLRSVGSFDTIPIAKNYGGGGHVNATGFVIKSD